MCLAYGVVQEKLLDTIQVVVLANNQGLVVTLNSHLNFIHLHVALTHSVVDLGYFLVLWRFDHVEILDGRVT